MQIGDKLRQLRNQHDLTQQELADTLHLSRKTISGWETGRSYPDINSLIQISELFHVPTDDLLKDNHMLKHYAEQTKLNKKDVKIERVTYVINIVMLILGYVQMFHFGGIHSPFITLFLLINMIMFISHYSNWESFKRKAKLAATIIAFFVFLALNILTIPFNDHFIGHLAKNDNIQNVGMATGEFVLILLITLSLTLAVFFRVKHRKD